MSPALEHNDELGLPWDEWQDGRPERLVRGRDFFQPVQALNEAAQNAARRLGKAVRLVPDVRGSKTYAWVQFSDYEVVLGEPCPRCSSYDIRRINPQYAVCADCKATLALVLPKRGKDDSGAGGPPEKGEEILRLLLGPAPARRAANPAKLERARTRAARPEAADAEEAAPAPKTRAMREDKIERGRAKAERAEEQSGRAKTKAASGAGKAAGGKAERTAQPRAVPPVSAEPPQTGRPLEAAPAPIPEASQGENGSREPDLRVRPGKRFFNEHAGLASASLVTEDGDPRESIHEDEECWITITVDVVTIGMQMRAVVALQDDDALRYRAVQAEPFLTRRGGPHQVTVRIPPNRIRPGTYSTRVGMQLIHEGELTRIVRGDALAFQVLESDLAADVTEPSEPEEAPSAQGGPDFVELEGTWTVRRVARSTGGRIE